MKIIDMHCDTIKECFLRKENLRNNSLCVDLEKMKKNNGFSNEKMVAPVFVDGEVFVGEYQALRDFIVFTNKRIIAVNVQGLTGKK